MSKKTRRLAVMVHKCLKGVDFTRESFVFNGNRAENSKGETLFYSAKEIDKGIDKINKLLRRLNK